MNRYRHRPRPLLIQNGPRKNVDIDPPPNLASSLSPDLQPNSPPTFPQEETLPLPAQRIGNYLLLENAKAIHIQSQKQYVYKVIPVDKYRETLSAYWAVESSDYVNEIGEILLGSTNSYIFFERNYGDLHSYVRNKKKLKEEEAIRLFRQIVAAVECCHSNGVVLRDLKLRKFVFKDKERTKLMLEGLEDACILEDEEDDHLLDKHGCPAYVSPEILNTNERYSGKAADIWSLGVMLYTMLIGRYPFHGTEPSTLFSKIRRGQFNIPDTISSKAKCLIKAILRRSPWERLTATQILQHPWLNKSDSFKYYPQRDSEKDQDQCVPDFNPEDTRDFFI